MTPKQLQARYDTLRSGEQGDSLTKRERVELAHLRLHLVHGWSWRTIERMRTKNIVDYGHEFGAES